MPFAPTLRLSACLLFTAALNTASADAIFSNEADFLAAAGPGLQFESFEDLVAANTFVSNTITTPVLTVQTAPQSNLGVQSGNNPANIHPTDGVQYAGWIATPGDPDVTFTFNQPVNAFGVTLTDAIDNNIPAASMSLSTNTGASFPSFVSGALTTGNELFVGIITDTPFTAATFTVSQIPVAGDAIGFDAVYTGLVPEPASVVLLTLGVLSLAACRHKHRSL